MEVTEFLAQDLARRQVGGIFAIVFDSQGRPVANRNDLLTQKPKGSA